MVSIRVLIFLFCASLLSSTTIVAKDIWLTVKDFDLRVQKGSALDFEPLFKNQQSNLGDKWDERYLCAPLEFTRPNGFFPSKPDLEQLVLEFKSRGYNLVRLHFLDNILMNRAKKDFDFDPVQADRIHYLLFLLNKNNIYYMLDAATSWNGAYGDVGKNRFVKKHNLRLNVHFNQTAQMHWKKMVDLMLASINPYTGRKVLQEPNLIAITTFNEMGIGFNTGRSEQYPSIVKYKFQQWLKQNGYRDVITPKRLEVSEASSLMNHFFLETERKTFAWMRKYLRDQGYKGRVTAYNNGKTVQSIGVRQDLDLISVHAYHDHPTKFVRQGSLIKNTSSIASELSYIQYMSLVREIGKPFVVDEYDLPYWSQWRRESGISMAAFASFQDWNAICRYANPVVLKYGLRSPRRQRALYPFAIGMDPVARAGEALSALLFRRNDVEKGGSVTGILFQSSDFISDKSLKQRLPEAFTRLSLITPIGTMYHSSDEYNVDIVIPFIRLGGNGTEWTPRWKQWKDNLSTLKISGILFRNEEPTEEFISSTGEIFLNPSMKMLKVITNKTEAIVYDRLNSPEYLNKLTILKASGESVLSVSSIDNAFLKDSKRMLVIFATDARNSSSQISTDGRRLIKLGKLPVQIKSQSVVFSLETNNASRINFYVLNLRGKRVGSLPVQRKSNEIIVNIDLFKLKNGPTTFFELALD